MQKRKLCCSCRKLTANWQKESGSPAQCYDGCFSTLGFDSRTIDGKPAWLPHGKLSAWDPKRMIGR